MASVPSGVLIHTLPVLCFSPSPKVNNGTPEHLGIRTPRHLDTRTPGHQDTRTREQWDTGTMFEVGVRSYHSRVVTFCIQSHKLSLQKIHYGETSAIYLSKPKMQYAFMFQIFYLTQYKAIRQNLHLHLLVPHFLVVTG